MAFFRLFPFWTLITSPFQPLTLVNHAHWTFLDHVSFIVSFLAALCYTTPSALGNKATRKWPTLQPTGPGETGNLHGYDVSRVTILNHVSLTTPWGRA
jgi:hypothetical protein